MKLKLTELVELSFFFCLSKKPGEILIFVTKIAKFWIFACFSRKMAIFRFRHALWRNNYVTPWPIVLLLVYSDIGIQYLSIDSNKYCCNNPLVRRVTKNSLARRGLKCAFSVSRMAIDDRFAPRLFHFDATFFFQTFNQYDILGLMYIFDNWQFSLTLSPRAALTFFFLLPPFGHKIGQREFWRKKKHSSDLLWTDIYEVSFA